MSSSNSSCFVVAFATLLSRSKSITPEALLVATRRIIFLTNRLAVGFEKARAGQSPTPSSPFVFLLPYAETLATQMPRALLESASLSGNRRFAKTCWSLWRGLHSIMPQRQAIFLSLYFLVHHKTMLRFMVDLVTFFVSLLLRVDQLLYVLVWYDCHVRIRLTCLVSIIIH